MLNHPSIVVRYYAAYGLGKLGDKDSIQALKDSLWLPENDTPEDLLGSSPKDMWDGPRRLIYANGGYRQIACWALRQLGDTSVDKRFIEILFEDPSTAIPADLKKRIAELITQLGDSDWNKREEAQNALSEIGEAACMQLDEAKNSKDPEVVQRVSQLLEPLAHAYMRRRPEAYACLKTVASQELLKIRVENDTPFPYLEAHLSGCITHGYRRP
jgi:HEAT repeat protein